MHRRLSLLVTLAALCIAFACGSPSQPPTAESRGVSIMFQEGPLSTTLVGESDRLSEIFGGLVSDGLVGYNAKLEFIPLVAESWELDEERKTLTFHIRDGVRWHDGEPVTARDVAETWRIVRRPDTQAITWAPLMESIRSVEVVDELTVRVRYRDLPAEPLEVWRVPLLPGHIVGRLKDLPTSSFADAPIGCGAFRFVGYQPETRLVLEANPDYWAGAPQIPMLTMKFFSDERTAYEAMLLGNLDILPVSPDLWAEAADDPRASVFEREAFYRLMTWYVGWNGDGSNPFFADARVRRGMTLALDRERFNNSVLQGMSLLGATSYHPHWAWADPAIKPRAYDVSAATAEFKAAGWVDHDGDGILDKDGRPLQFTLLMNASSREIVRRLVQWMQDAYRDAGIVMKIDVLEWAAFQQRRREHSFEAMLGVFSFTPDPDQLDLYHTDARENGFNYVGFSDPECDRLLEEIRITRDPEERRRKLFELQQLLFEQEPLTNLFHMPTPILRHRDLQGVVTSPLDFLRFHPGPRNWYWTGSDAD